MHAVRSQQILTLPLLAVLFLFIYPILLSKRANPAQLRMFSLPDSDSKIQNEGEGVQVQTVLLGRMSAMVQLVKIYSTIRSG